MTGTHKYVSLSRKTVLGVITNHLGVILVALRPRSDVARDTLTGSRDDEEVGRQDWVLVDGINRQHTATRWY